jgi:hypothetical protein
MMNEKTTWTEEDIAKLVVQYLMPTLLPLHGLGYIDRRGGIEYFQGMTTRQVIEDFYEWWGYRKHRYLSPEEFSKHIDDVMERIRLNQPGNDNATFEHEYRLLRDALEQAEGQMPDEELDE